MVSMKHASWLAAVVIAAAAFSVESPSVSSAAVAPERFPGGWYALLNFDFNSFHPWSRDPISLLLPKEHWWRFAAALQGALFVLGFIACGRLTAAAGAAAAAAAGALGWLTLFWCFGRDSLTLPFICVLPLLQAALLFACSRKLSLLSVLPAAAGGFGACLFMQQLAPLGVLFALIGAVAASKPGRRKNLAFAAGAALLPAIFYAVSSPAPIFPAYPLQARVVPDDGLPGMLRPLLGADSSIPITNWMALRSAVGGLWPGIAALLLLAAALQHGRQHTAGSRTASLAAGVLLAVLGDALAPTWLASILPVQALARLWPGGVFYVPLVLLVLASGICWSFYSAALSGRRWGSWALGIVLLSAAAAFPAGGGRQFSELFRPGQVYSGGADSVFREFLRREAHLQRPQQVREEALHHLLSPSYAVYHRRGLGVLYNQARYARKDFTAPPVLAAVHSSAGGAQKFFSALVDGDESTRWFAGGGGQQGSEWLFISFESELWLDGVELSTGAFVTDYPRGIAVFGGGACGADAQQTLQRAQSGVPLFAENDWQGPVLYTSEGYPYFGTQNYVRLHFSGTVPTNCLLIRQTGRDPHYDWSVAELRLLLPAEKQSAVQGTK